MRSSWHSEIAQSYNNININNVRSRPMTFSVGLSFPWVSKIHTLLRWQSLSNRAVSPLCCNYVEELAIRGWFLHERRTSFAAFARVLIPAIAVRLISSQASSCRRVVTKKRLFLLEQRGEEEQRDPEGQFDHLRPCI